MVEKAGIPVAGIDSTENLRRVDRQRAERNKALYEFAAGFADQTPEEIERETARAIAEVRAERRAENFKALDAIGEAFKDVSEEELEREVARAIAEVHAKRRSEREQAEPES